MVYHEWKVNMKRTHYTSRIGAIKLSFASKSNLLKDNVSLVSRAGPLLPKTREPRN